jgi:hypothetical protein
MSLRFWRRVRVVPGLRVNLSRSGASLSIGRRGAWYTTGPRCRRVTAGWAEKLPPVAATPQGRRTWVVLLMLVVLAVCAMVMASVSLTVP